MRPQEIDALLKRHPRLRMGHLPTPIEQLPRLGQHLGMQLSVKRDDCTGIAFGGNKVRQLEFYLGRAHDEGADTILITGAVQSNYVRTAAAMAARAGMTCHIQLEERVPGVSALHRANGNVLLDRLLGATLQSYPEGEDEAGADAALHTRAQALRAEGRRPFVVPLGAEAPPTGALGYVAAAVEVMAQFAAGADRPDVIVVGSGSGLTHAGLLTGLRLLGEEIAVQGVCVRGPAPAQAARVLARCEALCALLGIACPVEAEDVCVTDVALAPGYGRLNDATGRAISDTARLEGLLLDPVYTGKVVAAAAHLAREGLLMDRAVMVWHTGGQPALFGYADQLA